MKVELSIAVTLKQCECTCVSILDLKLVLVVLKLVFLQIKETHKCRYVTWNVGKEVGEG